jgi:hypothetical protein
MITIAFLIAIIANQVYYHKTTMSYAILAVIIVIFLIVADLTSDAPGSIIWDKLRSKKKDN